MLNLSALCRLLMIPFGALSGLGAAQANKFGTLAIVIFTCIGLLLGLGISWLSLVSEKRLFIRGNHPIAYALMPLVWLLAAVLAPALFGLIIFEVKKLT